jgi:hypothetical protein
MRGNAAANGAGAEPTLSIVVAHPGGAHQGGALPLVGLVAVET